MSEPVPISYSASAGDVIVQDDDEISRMSGEKEVFGNERVRRPTRPMMSPLAVFANQASPVGLVDEEDDTGDEVETTEEVIVDSGSSMSQMPSDNQQFASKLKVQNIVLSWPCRTYFP